MKSVKVVSIFREQSEERGQMVSLASVPLCDLELVLMLIPHRRTISYCRPPLKCIQKAVPHFAGIYQLKMQRMTLKLEGRTFRTVRQFLGSV
jgi:hypothetical protein